MRRARWLGTATFVVGVALPAALVASTSGADEAPSRLVIVDDDRTGAGQPADEPRPNRSDEATGTDDGADMGFIIAIVVGAGVLAVVVDGARPERR